MRMGEFDSKNSIKPFLIVFSIFIILITSTQVQGQNSIESGWEIVNSDVEKDIVNVIATEGEIVWAFGRNGLIMNSNDKGLTWNINNQITNENLTSSDYLNGNLVVVGDNGKVIQLTEDNGWKDISIPGILTNIKGVAITSEDSIFVITNNSRLWNYDGISWDEKIFDISNEFNSISFIDSNNGLNGIIVGDGGLILTTIDGGVNWELVESPEEIMESNINSVDLYSSSKAYALTDSGEILISRSLETSIGFDWDLVNVDRMTNDEINFVNIKVINPLKVIITGTDYIATSKDGGNTFEEHNLSLISNGMANFINDLTFIDGYCGVAVGNNGLILLTAQNEYGCTEGLDQSVGFEIEEFNNFGIFIEKYAPWMLDGLIATMKIVGFGILFGFLIGITLAMCKTAPTSLKDMIESHLERVIFFSWLVIPFSVLISRYYGNLIFAPITIIIALVLTKLIEIYTKNKINKELNDREGLFGLIIPSDNRLFLTRSLGLSLIIGIPEFVGFELKGGLIMIINSINSFRSLDINGIEYIFSPVGDPIGFSYLLFGIGILIPGILLFTSNGKYSDIEISYYKDNKIKIKPWELRPLNSIATLYTDMFRNTPLVVQFLFLHFGIEIGMRIQLASDGVFDGIPYLADMFSDRIYLSAICALAMNSGAYQCETLRGAIAAIPSGQMEAGRSIGLTYIQTMRLIILPQSIRICIPPLGNEMVNLVLNSSLAMVIGYTELTRQGKLINAITFQITWTWGMVMISYFVVTWALALALRRIENKTRIPGLGIV